jgi:hypothetical protein
VVPIPGHHQRILRFGHKSTGETIMEATVQGQFSVRWDCKKMKNVRVGDKKLDSFVIREVDGRDEEISSGWAKAKGGTATATEELIRISIVEVNGETVKQPYLAFDTFNSRARHFVLVAFRSLNGATDDEDEAFLAAAGTPVGVGGDASATA